jgi:hypothetical protein
VSNPKASKGAAPCREFRNRLSEPCWTERGTNLRPQETNTRIYAVADIHGKAENIARIAASVAETGVDLLVAAGDLTRYRASREAVWQLNRLAVPCYGIRGNSDRPAVDRWLSAFPNTRTLHLRKQTREDIHFVGAGALIDLDAESISRIEMMPNIS